MLGIRLQDPVGALTGAPVATIRSTATLREAAEALTADLIGLLVVVDAHGVAGSCRNATSSPRSPTAAAPPMSA